MSLKNIIIRNSKNYIMHILTELLKMCDFKVRNSDFSMGITSRLVEHMILVCVIRRKAFPLKLREY